MMFNYYSKLTLRNLLRFKGYTTINVIGLSFSIMVCLLIVQHILDDLSYDKHHQDSEQLYRVATDWNINGQERTAAGTPSPLASNLEKDFPEVLDATRIYKAPNVDQYILEYEDKVFFEKLGAFADPNFFDLLTYDFIHGEPSKVLEEPLTIVLSDEIAQKLFGQENPIGKAVKMTTNWGKDEYRVTGVFNSRTYASHLETGFYASGQGGSIGSEFYQLDEWAGMNLYYTYLKLNPQAQPEKLNEAFPNWLENYAGDRLRELGIGKGHFLQPIEGIYLDSSVSGFWFGRTGNKNFVYILASIAALLLLIACINFMNLATAKATVRAQEVGTRKVLGANRRVLVYQFMSEAFIYASLAVILAFGFAKITLPVFNNLTDKSLSLPILQNVPYLLGFIGVITLLAGSYPALYLSSFSPSKIFKNNYSNQFSAQRIRQGLVVLQFVIGIGLIQGVFIINQQLNFIGNKDLGYDPSAKIVIPFNTEDAAERYDILRDELLENPQIQALGGTTSHPAEDNLSSFFYFKEGQNPDEGFHAYNAGVTPEYLEMMGFKVLAGRLFDRQRISSDTIRKAVITSTAMQGIGFEVNNVVGENISMMFGEDKLTFEVIGVIEDFHSNSLHYEVEGQVFDWSPEFPLSYAIADVETQDIASTLANIEATWQKINPNDPFEFHFLEDQLQQNYLAEQRASGLIFYATLLAIFISCLGLLGLASFATERRVKEIGIRKVLGASVGNIVGLLSKDFVALVLIALILASPIAWWLCQNWLEDFTFRIEMKWWMFLPAGIVAIVVALLTVSLQSVKAALANPIESLKNE